MMIRYATPLDMDAINAIARMYPHELAFVRRVSIQRAIDALEAFVAEVEGEVVGFVLWHARRDGWQTVYDLAVHPDHTGAGIGRALLYAVPAPVRLRCPVDNAAANRFYAGAGLVLAEVVPGKNRALNVWELRVLSIFCAGNNHEVPDVARRAGMAYGTRHDNTSHAWPFFVDINFQNYDWQQYMDVIHEHCPVMAMCADYERPDQRRELYRQIRDLRAAGVLRVMVCPKFPGAIAHIPSWCVVAVSVPTGSVQYKGWLPDLRDLRGRRVHLLGGSPRLQKTLIVRIGGHGGHVLSVDGNSHQVGASRGSVWSPDGWRRNAYKRLDQDTRLDRLQSSSGAITLTMHRAAEHAQLPLPGF